MSIKIPKSEYPGSAERFCFKDEPLISVKEYFGDEIITEPFYYNKGIEKSVYDLKLRLTVLEQLSKARLKLPGNLTFKIYDAWRPQEVQKELYRMYYDAVCRKQNLHDERQIQEEVKKFVSFPSDDLNNAPVHNTGGAVDLTIADKFSGRELNMGTEFDEFTEKSYTDYYEGRGYNEISENRRMLYWCMIDSGFTNLPTEWWHYDYGTSFWSFYTGKPVMYKGIR